MPVQVSDHPLIGLMVEKPALGFGVSGERFAFPPMKKYQHAAKVRANIKTITKTATEPSLAAFGSVSCSEDSTTTPAFG
jgi:hypothetical protein